MENSMGILGKKKTKTRTKTTIRPNNPTTGIFPEEIITEKDTCTSMFTTVLFTAARTWEQPRFMSINK